jgi:deoxyribonuclease IV
VPPLEGKARVSAGSRPPKGHAAPRIGAHCKGGLAGAVQTALSIGAEAIQVFIGSPQTWRVAIPDETTVAAFRADVARHRLGPVFVHASYLVNAAAVAGPIRDKSIVTLYWQLREAERAGAAGLIFHPGSFGTAERRDALGRVAAAMAVVLDGYSGSCRLLLETTAGQGASIGSRFEDLGDLLAAFPGDGRVGVCWDTCHLFAAGYDIATGAGLERTVAAFDDVVGLEHLHAVHANDSKTPLGSRRDRHANIGAGHIGETAFRRMLRHPALRPLPWILEVPGLEDGGPDRASIDTLRSLAGRRPSRQRSIAAPRTVTRRSRRSRTP